MSDDHNCPVARTKEFHCPWFEKEKQIITLLRAENEKLRAALKMARPFIGWAGYYPTILAEVDAALEEKP